MFDVVYANVSRAAGFGVLAGTLAVVLAVFLIGIKRYRKQRPTGSPFTTMAQVLVAAVKKWRVSETHGGGGICYEDDRVSGSNTNGQTRSHNLARTEQLSAVITQMHTFFTNQGSTMSRSIGLVETARVNTASKHGLLGTLKAILPMTVRWLVPQYVLTRIGDAFTVFGLQELFYDQMPEEMRSIGEAAYIRVVRIGSFVNTVIISVVQAITSKHGREWLGESQPFKS
ncbi:hypothetical protein F3Y22_tig00110499pilonHSYRG00059 [Hibiscus syriacus]|uniref:Uncharacterized protein n=1 Tax=Hibiscus syriacus TaxID=106335 RepID=A0A6A3ACI5_HIBSY|nr:hypothetical protein F3Y22_tig00110499pilonHSYRG00059 [Hibiscus syriacus]